MDEVSLELCINTPSSPIEIRIAFMGFLQDFPKQIETRFIKYFSLLIAIRKY